MVAEIIVRRHGTHVPEHTLKVLINALSEMGAFKMVVESGFPTLSVQVQDLDTKAVLARYGIMAVMPWWKQDFDSLVGESYPEFAGH